MSPATQITKVSGRAIPLRGHDIDTDRIMPARYLRVVSFDGLEQHLFEDDRKDNPQHPFGDPRYTGSAVLVVNGNFGCGSSREHAPQGLVRYGIRAIVGESFSEIFQGNSVLLGLPCIAADPAAIEQLQALIEATPDVIVDASIESGAITAGSLRLQGSVPPALRDAFISGQWNGTAMLLDKFDEVRAIASSLPYVSGF
ncbi:MAG: isopropylmalate isomerase [Acidobacteriota bacterium]